MKTVKKMREELEKIHRVLRTKKADMHELLVDITNQFEEAEKAVSYVEEAIKSLNLIANQ